MMGCTIMTQGCCMESEGLEKAHLGLHLKLNLTIDLFFSLQVVSRRRKGKYVKAEVIFVDAIWGN